MSEHRACSWCGKPAPESSALLSIVWWCDYECCSVECTIAYYADVEDATGS